MTREQAKREIDSLDFYLQNHTDDYGEESHTAMMMAIKALEQEPCEDAISRQSVDTLVDELARAISDERCGTPRGRSAATIMQDILDLPPVNPQPCEDAISKEATLKPYKDLNDEDTISVWLIRKNIEQQPPVTPQPKTGHWINGDCKGGNCSICGEYYAFYPESGDFNYCPNCGAKMIESEDKE